MYINCKRNGGLLITILNFNAAPKQRDTNCLFRMFIAKGNIQMGKHINRKVLTFASGTFLVFCAFHSFSISLPKSVIILEEKIRQVEVEETTINSTKICERFIVQRRSFPSSCGNYTTKLCEEGTFPLTALVSYPGSGNTWIRHLIEISTGYFTGSVYFDPTLYARGFLGEKDHFSSGSTIVQKLHLKYDPRQGFTKAILMIRDPYFAVRSFVDYLESGHHTGWASPTTFSRKEWPMFLLHSTHDWLVLAKSWLESDAKLLVIHYENVVSDLFQEVQKICDFLELECPRIATECFKKNSEGLFHRRKPHWNTKFWILPKKVKDLIDDGIDYLNELLLADGKEPIPLTKYLYYRNSSIKL